MGLYEERGYLFCDGDLFATLDAHYKRIGQKVDSIPEQQFINTDVETLIQHVVSEMEVQPLVLYEDRMEMDQEETKVDVSHRFDYNLWQDGRRVQTSGLKVTVSLPFSGDPTLWKLKPNQWQTIFPQGHIRNPDHNGIGYLDIVMQQPSNDDPSKLKSNLDSTLETIRFYLNAQQKQIEQENAKLEGIVRNAINARKGRLEKHSSVVKALNIPLKKKNGVPDITPIQINKRTIKPLPPVQNKPPEHGIRDEDYEYILNVIRHEGATYEATPSTYKDLGEEALRDIMLAHLNGHYQGDATGETFRKNGKTDIRIEHDNRAAFVAECKIWHGDKKTSETIDQLLGYLTWRDSKTCIILFNKEVAGFTSIQKKLSSIFESHPNYIRSVDSGNAQEWRFVFKSEDDEERQLTIHVFLFNLYVR